MRSVVFAFLVVAIFGAVLPEEQRTVIRKRGVNYLSNIRVISGEKSNDDDAVNKDAAQSAVFHYFGGPIISNPEVSAILWNENTLFQEEMDMLYRHLSEGRYMNFFQEYNVEGQEPFGVGKYLGSHVCSTCDNGNMDISVDEVVAALTQLILDGSVPYPNKNSYYAISFPPEYHVTVGEDVSCEVYCAIHQSFEFQGMDVAFGIIPDLGSSGCENGCGVHSVLENTMYVASHEFAEAITDPVTGVEGVDTWRDSNGMELADTCAHQAVFVSEDEDSFVVQKLWSNAMMDCVDPMEPLPVQGGYCRDHNAAVTTLALFAGRSYNGCEDVAAQGYCHDPLLAFEARLFCPYSCGVRDNNDRFAVALRLLGVDDAPPSCADALTYGGFAHCLEGGDIGAVIRRYCPCVCNDEMIRSLRQ
eukprot:c10024_g1_i2.p1 GENE.c10024_g1_i2~~c10024_g1_i2.p1  ORF type:complete len:416 (+),score=80.72 c10024_g1_i2:40-1287(+)